jgi:hypothetical protein
MLTACFPATRAGQTNRESHIEFSSSHGMAVMHLGDHLTLKNSKVIGHCDLWHQWLSSEMAASLGRS